MIGTTETNRVRSDDLGEVVEHLERIVVLACADLWDTDLERVEHQVRNAFQLGLNRTDTAAIAPRRDEAQITQAKARADSAFGSGKHQRVAHVTEAQFVDRIGAKILRITEIDHLRTASGNGVVGEIRGRHGSSAVGERSIQQVIVGKIITKDHSESRVLVNADATLIVAQVLGVRRGYKKVIWIV